MSVVLFLQLINKHSARLRVVLIYQHLNICFLYAFIELFPCDKAVYIILPCYLVIHESLSDSLKLQKLRIITAFKGHVGKDRRQIGACPEVRVTLSGTAEIHLIEIQLISDTVELHAEIARISEPFEKFYCLFCVFFTYLVYTYELTGKCDSAAVLSNSGLAYKSREYNFLIEAHSCACVFLIDIKELLNDDIPICMPCTHYAKMLSQLILVIANCHFCLKSLYASKRLNIARIYDILRDHDIFASKGYRGSIRCEQANFRRHGKLCSLVHKSNKVSLLSVSQSRHKEELTQCIPVRINYRCGIVVSREQQRFALGFPCVAHYSFHKSRIVTLIALLYLFGDYLSHLIEIFAAGSDIHGSFLICVRNQVYGVTGRAKRPHHRKAIRIIPRKNDHKFVIPH